MPPSFERKGRQVPKTFSNSEVIEYLTAKLNADRPRFKISAMPKFCNGVMAKLDDTYFIVYASNTWIEISFDRADAGKMSEVIEKFTKWGRFSEKEPFYVEIDEESSRTIIFENGYIEPEAYKNGRYFKNDKLKITFFR